MPVYNLWLDRDGRIGAGGVTLERLPAICEEIALDGTDERAVVTDVTTMADGQPLIHAKVKT